MQKGETAPELAAQAKVGAVVAGKYYLKRLMGCGSMGAVYEAKHRFTNQQVAVKLLHPSLATSEEHVARFLREARAASAVGHQSIVRVLDAGSEETGRGRTIYLVLELLTGEDLESAMTRGAVTLGEAVEITVQLLEGLAAAHARGIVHRDIKPENVYLSRDAEGKLLVKLLDFGVAKYLIKHGGRSSWDSMDGLVVGTPHYMSPEQCKGMPVDARTDIWSTGALLYHLLAGRPPHDADTLGELLTKIVTQKVAPLAAVRPDVPPNIARVVDRALTQDPAARWPTALQMADELRGRGAPISDLDWDD